MEAMAQEERHDLLLRMKRNDGGQSHSTAGKLELLGTSTPAKFWARPRLNQSHSFTKRVVENIADRGRECIELGEIVFWVFKP